ncbi:hypothetical protein [Nocardia jejuensis]|uniref:hypothetical protein n=1 Tax=Nocardia jejuensis TaxID=328049 RepID=UPI001C3FCE0A|nr:hypothetical protein [Nocardia jejuensis]
MSPALTGSGLFTRRLRARQRLRHHAGPFATSHLRTGPFTTHPRIAASGADRRTGTGDDTATDTHQDHFRQVQRTATQRGGGQRTRTATGGATPSTGQQHRQHPARARLRQHRQQQPGGVGSGQPAPGAGGGRDTDLFPIHVGAASGLTVTDCDLGVLGSGDDPAHRQCAGHGGADREGEVGESFGERGECSYQRGEGGAACGVRGDVGVEAVGEGLGGGGGVQQQVRQQNSGDADDDVLLEFDAVGGVVEQPGDAVGELGLVAGVGDVGGELFADGVAGFAGQAGQGGVGGESLQIVQGGGGQSFAGVCPGLGGGADVVGVADGEVPDYPAGQPVREGLRDLNTHGGDDRPRAVSTSSR